MLRASPIRRVVLVVLDGLRPDAIPRFGLSNIERLAHAGASTMLARTVSPSVTACAMASLLTGAAPERHGLQSERFHIPRPRGALHPLPRLLADHALPTSAFLAAMPTLFGGIAHRIAAHLGIQQAHFRGKSCDEILATATRTLRGQRRGLIVLHLPDADRAGHDHGWMSDGYAIAARRMDSAVGALLKEIDLTDPATLLIALADHGGGGAVRDHHNSEHPLDRTIPLMLAGGSVHRGELAHGASLLDVPATICWALGIPRPESYAGTPLVAAFTRTTVEAAA
jgi:predicted AlkP superfamily pyrophosphatase or phosphodiesterase